MAKRNKNTAAFARIDVDPERGLSSAQVEGRKKEGAVNVTSGSIEKSYLRIFCENAFTFFNVVLYIIGLMFAGFMIYLRASGHEAVEKEYFGITKFIFLVCVVMNVVIGTIQGFRSKATLKKLRIVTESKVQVIRDGEKTKVPASEVVLDDVIFVAAGDQVSVDAVVLSGEVSVDESLLTGESDNIKKGPGDILYSGSFVTVGSARAKTDKIGDDTYASQLSNKVKSLSGHKSELMVNIYRIINVLSVVLFVIVAIVVGTLVYKVAVHGENILGPGEGLDQPTTWARIFVTTASFAIGVIPTGLVLITSVTLAVSIVNLSKQNTLIQELYSLENLSRVDVICLDKTGTLTDGTMNVVDVKAEGDEQELEEALRHILGCFESTNMTSAALLKKFGSETPNYEKTIPFSSATKCSGYLGKDGVEYLMGAPEYILPKDHPGLTYAKEQAEKGLRVIAVTKDKKALGFIALEDGIRTSAKDTITFFYENGVDVRIISGDNSVTVAKIAKIAGVRDTEKAISLEGMPVEKIPEIVMDYVIFARVSPEQKQALVEALQANGKKVAMTGDGVNDILALRKANASITFNNATDAAKSCADVVLLDNDFSHLKAVVGEGRRVVNNIERTAVLFLMKGVAVASLAVALIPMVEGQMSYSLENVYLLETAIIGTGGFLMSLEPTKSPIKGKFMRNVLAKAIISGVIVFAAAILPVLLYKWGAYGGLDTVAAKETRTALISIMTALAGLTVLTVMAMPLTRYRLVVLILVIGNVALFALALPSVFLGAKAIRVEGESLLRLLKEAFQPWNSSSVRALFVTNVGTEESPLYQANWAAIFTMVGYVVIALPLYYVAIRLTKKILDKKNEEDRLASLTRKE